MATISIEDLFLVTLVLVDDWYQQKGRIYSPGKGRAGVPIKG